jgi:hypothetical protein
MMITIEDQCNRFSDLIQLHELYYSTIIECRAKPCSIFAKPVSEKEVAIFGDYKVVVLHRNLFTSGKKDYGSITIRKNICEIVPFEVKENTEIKPALLLQPTCNFKFEKHQSNNLYWEIEVQGEIKMESTETNISNNFAPSIGEPVPSQERKGKPFHSQVWQFEGNEDVVIEQLMEMDLESLKNMGKKSDH